SPDCSSARSSSGVSASEAPAPSVIPKKSRRLIMLTTKPSGCWGRRTGGQEQSGGEAISTQREWVNVAFMFVAKRVSVYAPETRGSIGQETLRPFVLVIAHAHERMAFCTRAVASSVR